MKRIYSTIPLLLVTITAAFAQTEVTTETSKTPEIVYSLSPRTYEIGDITIDGADEYDHNTLMGISGLIVGQTISFPKADGEITTAIRNFWNQRTFSEVSITADSIVGSKIYLHIQLAPHPKLSTITYTGIKKSEREDLEEKYPLQEGNVISVDVINRIKHVITKHFEEKGFKNVTAEVIQRDDPKRPGYVTLEVDVNKNEKIKVHRIYITGADQDKVKSLKKAMKKTREGGKMRNWFSSKKFIAERYKEDKASLIKRYNSWGYRDAYIESDSVVPFDERHVDIYIDVSQGDKYYIRDITWVGNSVYSTDALSKSLALNRGDIYNQEHLEKRLDTSGDDNSIGNEYYTNGYVFSHIEPVETQVVGDSIDLEIRIREGKQATLNRVSIQGNEYVYEDVIRRELRTKPGDLFSKDAIIRSLTDIGQMGHFDPEKLEPDIQPNESDGTVDITYKLEYKSSDQLEFSLGYGSTGVTGRIAVKFGNFAIQDLFKKSNRRNLLPQGEGQTLELAAQTNGTYYQQYSISFTDPWFGRKRPNQFSVSLFYSKQTDVNSNYYNSAYYNNYYSRLYGYGTSSSYYDYSDYYDPDKYVQIIGGSIGWGKRLRWPDDWFTLSAALTFNRNILKPGQY